MPKMKTHSATKKRFRLTGGGKVVYQKSGRRHLTGHKGASRIRRLRQQGVLTETLTRTVKTLLPYA
ncbi:50S ribosomal protein L35 [Aminithiophilus ramosus]|uniref:Large ribosomal subunit protein bL35 n=2 Tax=Synergistales TaxID=649776 RepID=A0A9Q7AK03_9BACT|nr:50S ribosomal protein L35 [Aminithiophilus ramosus]QTX31342.1 50S ribosomal protein L35 [Aminithiophilus ramosus]QVL35141.1 50S ribosomal protein L35 [Synergistota bacterium]